MKISFIGIQNFRKLKATHIGFHSGTTLLVGANNSGRTSAMVALRYFLLSLKILSLILSPKLGHWICEKPTFVNAWRAVFGRA